MGAFRGNAPLPLFLYPLVHANDRDVDVTTANVLLPVLGAGVCLLGLLAGSIRSGGYDVAADVPHWQVTAELLGTLRNRSIEVRARRVQARAR